MKKLYPFFLSPLSGFVALQLPLIWGLKPENPWSIFGAIWLLLSMWHQWRKGISSDWNLLLDKRVLGCVSLLFVMAWIALIPLKYYSLSYNLFDTGIFASELNLFLHTGRYWSSIQKMHALRDHFTPNLLLLSPILSLGSSLVLLHVFKLIAHISSAFIIYKIGENILGRESRFKLAMPTLWLVHSFVDAKGRGPRRLRNSAGFFRERPGNRQSHG